MTPDGLRLPEFFLSEWESRRPGEGRSLTRARRLGDALGLFTQTRPVLSVVGSKGKGTAALYASAFLAAAGQRVVTVTGPGYRTATERIRVDGLAVSAASLTSLAARLRTARDAAADRSAGDDRGAGDERAAVPDRGAGDGYLAPTGLFTLAGVLHAGDVAADVIVLEAGMGGVSDEISLFTPAVVALTPIFAEHVGKLGGTPAEIARNKAGIVAPATRAVLTIPQTADVALEIMATVKERSHGNVRVEVIDPGSTAIPARLWPAGLSAHNAELGCAAAQRLLNVTGQPQPAARRLAAVLGSVRLPGRLSRHELPRSATELIVDSAISQAGIAAALAAAAGWWTGIDHVLLCLPDHKDVPGAVRELAGLPVTFVRLPDERLRFAYPLPADWTVIDAGQMTHEFVAGLGRRVIALGTVYFTGRVLDLVKADTERLFTI
jgi:dihydrofolate synthase / folylpolyglutamate synthase